MNTVIRLIIYGLLILINGLIYYFLHSHFYFMLMVILIMAPFISIIMAFILRKIVSVSVEAAAKGMNSEYGSQNEKLYFFIKINNPSILLSLDSIIELEVSNTFFNTKGSKLISVPIRMRKGFSLELPIVPTLPGIINVRINKIYIRDLMSFVKLRKKTDASAEAIVMPELITGYVYDRTALEQGSLESEESSKRGSDFSDVQEIREYIPGDKLMSIHWKLSAKRDILMVKDRASMSDKQMVALPELCGNDPALLAMILSGTYSLVNQIVQDGTTVRLMYWSTNRYEYDYARIDYKSDLDEAFARLFYEKTYSDMDEAASHMAAVHPEIKSYLHIYAEGERLSFVIKENG
ncbi:MAG: DUF58 domain-containing protein [Lachnospiraceae bacterium]|nr:DUF58 domain-containing protein [Lachnospiraceae bacterium]